MKPRVALAALVFLVLSSIVHAADPSDVWTLTTADFKTERVRLRDLNAHGVEVTPIAGGDSKRVAFEQFLELQRGISTPSATHGRFIAHLLDGNRFTGEPTATAGETINWNSKALGEVRLSMRNLQAIARTDEVVDLSSAEPRSEDVIVLFNGDTVRGVVGMVSSSAATIQPTTGGDATTVPLDAISAILFASTGGSTSTPARLDTKSSFRVTLAGRTSLAVASPSIQNGALKIDAGTGAIAAVPLSSVVAIEHVNGPVIWLSSLPPSENVQTPYLGLSWPARMNATVSGDPIRSNGREIAHGIGVHSYSRMSWPIAPGVQAFRTQYAIDGDQSYADVTVRIKLDGKVAHETTSVRAGPASPVVSLETGGAKTITLEVDYGASADVQDRVNWIEPALLRYKPVPSTQPTTQSN